MNRIDPDYFRSRAKHSVTQDMLLRVIHDLRTTLHANETVGTLQRQTTSLDIDTAVRDLSLCFTTDSGIFYARQGIQAVHSLNHVDLLHWLNRLSIDLKLLAVPDLEPELIGPITLERLAEGERLVNDLDGCRERLVHYR